jgi:hypothetical protein
MANLPLQQTLPQMQSKWKSILDPITANPVNNAKTLQRVSLISGQTNQVNHGLGKALQGWQISRRRQFTVTGTPTTYDIYDIQDTNQMPDLTLNLTCSQGTQANPVVVDLVVW